tara:strand:+ start:45 stop:305 length:261 start_codon:yes stop_codon:yes gene_type:complete
VVAGSSPAYPAMKLDLRRVNDKLYKILRYIPIHNVVDKKGKVNKKIIGLWVKRENGDHVLQENNNLLICETIQDIEYKEIKNKKKK